MMRDTVANIKEKFRSTVDDLPPEGVDELSRYLDTLADKYQVAATPDVVALGGLWAGVEFDVDDEDIRALRRKLSDEVLGQE